MQGEKLFLTESQHLSQFSLVAQSCLTLHDPMSQHLNVKNHGVRKLQYGNHPSGLPRWPSGKESACQADVSSIPDRG